MNVTEEMIEAFKREYEAVSWENNWKDRGLVPDNEVAERLLRAAISAGEAVQPVAWDRTGSTVWKDRICYVEWARTDGVTILLPNMLHPSQIDPSPASAGVVGEWLFKAGDRVYKPSGSWWAGVVVGTYSTEQTPRGYCVQLADVRNGPVQLYPEAALAASPATDGGKPE